MTGNSRHLLVASLLFVLATANCSLAQSVIERVKSNEAVANLTSDSTAAEATQRRPTPRPTFTPTPSYTDTPTNTPTPTITPIPTETPTPVATNTPVPTDTPAPTDTPPPTNTSAPLPPTATFTPAPTPTPSYAFRIAEQGDRAIQHTNYHVITIYVAVLDANSTPIGGYKMVGDHSPSGQHVESPPSDWSWSVANCLNCNYVKQGNLKFEPGLQEDGTWNIHLVDSGGTQVSETISLSYSSDKQQWVYDFLILQQK
jgi:hypothetical protein